MVPRVASRTWFVGLSFLSAVVVGTAAHGQALPPVPVPPQNPITEPKRLLGKILFWEEQLSHDNTVACGTCHRPAHAGGADPRFARHPGLDNLFNTPDDVFGSAGVVHRDASGQPIPDPIFGLDPQVTRRAAPSFLTAQFALATFWDGRATTAFNDPETGAPLIPLGAALENQAIQPILSAVEMANDGRSWADVRAKLAVATPLALASHLPADVEAALAGSPSYGQLFAAAFGDPAITGSRIAMAIATYERTLVANRTPWDDFVAGNPSALTPAQTQGLNIFNAFACRVCHTPPFFTNHSFRNIGLRPIAEDIGRQGVTGQPVDAGRFKVPSLRNVGLKQTFMHNGRLANLTAVVSFYRDPTQQFPANRDPLVPVPIPENFIGPVADFLLNGLVDSRVVGELFPFDRPTLASELTTGVGGAPGAVTPILVLHPAYPNPFNPHTTLRYSLRQSEQVEVAIVNPAGQLVRRLKSGPQPAGEHALSWDGRNEQGADAGSGVYFYRIAAGEAAASGQLVLAR